MPRTEHRNAARVALSVPIVVESIGQPEIQLHENLARVYSRVTPAIAQGEKYPGTLRDLSTNGAFIAAEPLPLLSRVALAFDLTGFGRVEAIGWALWRRSEDCVIPCEGQADVVLPKGFGVLFEAIPLDARLAIHRQVQRNSVN